jgi:hypothetical protein
MTQDAPAERDGVAKADRQNGYEDEGARHQADLARYEEELAQYESDLARYLQSRIKPGLSSGAIPLLARSIAKDIAKNEPPEAPVSADGSGEPEDGSGEPEDGSGDAEDGADDAEYGGVEASDFEADLHELQARLGEDWILCFSVQSENDWLTAETQDANQRVEAPDAERLVRIVEAINDGGGRQG